MAWGRTLTPVEIMPPSTANEAFPVSSHLLPSKINNLPRGAGLKAETYKRRRDEAISALLRHCRIADAAKALNIDLRTLYRWKSKPDFIQAFNQAKRELLESASIKARDQALSMMQVLVEVALDRNESGMARTAASKTLLDYALRFETAENIEARLEALEKANTLYGESSSDQRQAEQIREDSSDE